MIGARGAAMNELLRLNASEAARRIAMGELTSEALVQACLERIEARDERVGAWQHLDPVGALERARWLDRRPPDGLLHGIPVGLKDIIDTGRMPTTYGSSIYEGCTPQRDAHCVERLLEAGAVILGKTVTAEFAYYQPGPTRNPANPAHTPGGSSSGSAAAVADYQVPLALGTQTAGSIIRPASFTGVLGYKPTFGTFSCQGVRALAPSLDTLGGLARDFADFALLRQVLSVNGPDVAGEPKGAPRVALVRTAQWPDAQPAMQQAVELAARRLEQAGAEVLEREPPAGFDRLVDAQMAIMAVEAADAMSRELAEAPDALSDHMHTLIARGGAVAPAEEREARALADACRRQLGDLFADVDVVLTAAAAGEAPEGLISTGDPLFNRIWTLLGLPCVTYPVTRGPGGLPLGVQVVGRMEGDAELLAHARWMHAETGVPAGG